MAAVEFPNSLWAATAPERPPTLPLRGTEETDIAVIGAGFTGLSAAIEAARLGHAVTVLEGKAVGWGASGRNNGQVIPILTAAEPDVWVRRYGAAGERMVQLIGHSASVLFDLVREFDMKAEAEQNGWFQPAHSPGRVKLSQKRVEAWQRFGFPAELKMPARRPIFSVRTSGTAACTIPPAGTSIRWRWPAEMASAAESLGAMIHEQSPVTSFTRENAQWVIRTADRHAAGARTDPRHQRLHGRARTGARAALARSIVPVLSWQMATEPLGDNLRGKILPGRQAVSDTRGDLRFFRYDARNRLITGGAVIGAHDVASRVRNKAARNLGRGVPRPRRAEHDPRLVRLRRHELGPLPAHPPPRPGRLGLDRLQRARRRARHRARTRAGARGGRRSRGGAGAAR